MKELLKEIRALSAAAQSLLSLFAERDSAALPAEGIAFRATLKDSRLSFIAILDRDRIRFRELRGLEAEIAAIRRNSEQFLAGLPANNVLLYGPRGTGKSSVIKALLNEYHRRGLRMIEISRSALLRIHDVADAVRGRREKFILFCDDLSFDEDESVFREIKTLMEGGLQSAPSNLLIYATSNRRHLMPEKMEDNMKASAASEIHPEEAMEERLSLSDRFGLRIGFELFSADTYLNVVRHYAELRGLRIARRTLESEAMRWALAQGNYSGRTARQFADDIEGRIKLRKKR